MTSTKSQRSPQGYLQARLLPGGRQRRRKGTKRKHAEDDSTQEERDYQILTLITTKVTETETELQPLNKLFQALNDDKKKDGRGSKETIYLENHIFRHGQHLNMLLDCGSPSTIVGVETFKQIRNQQAFHFSLNSTSCTRFKGLKISFLFSWLRTRDFIISTTVIVTVAVGRGANATSDSRVL